MTHERREKLWETYQCADIDPDDGEKAAILPQILGKTNRERRELFHLAKRVYMIEAEATADAMPDLLYDMARGK
jgi:hypothetical protein